MFFPLPCQRSLVSSMRAGALPVVSDCVPLSQRDMRCNFFAWCAGVVRRCELSAAFSIAILCGLLVSYHLYMYDVTLVLLPVALLTGRYHRYMRQWPCSLSLSSFFTLARTGTFHGGSYVGDARQCDCYTWELCGNVTGQRMMLFRLLWIVRTIF